MANSINLSGLDVLLGAGNWLTDSYDLHLINGDTFVYLEGTTDDLADIPVGDRVANLPLVNKSISQGAIDADDLTFPSLAGEAVDFVMVVANTGVEANDTILIVWDTATGLPLTPNGNNLTTTFNVSGIANL